MINLYSELKTHIPLTLEDITSKGRKYTTVSIDVKEIRNLPDLINLWMIINILEIDILALPALVPDEQKKINSNFYFHTSLWCLKRFHEGLKGLHKTF